MRKKPRRFVGNAGPVCTSREDKSILDWIAQNGSGQHLYMFYKFKIKKISNHFPMFHISFDHNSEEGFIFIFVTQTGKLKPGQLNDLPEVTERV